MKLFLRAIAALSILAITATACAKKKDENAYDIEQRTFDAWMAENEPTAQKYSSGMYIKWLVENPDGESPQYGNWLKINYTGSTLNGDVFKTRNRDVALQENTYTVKTNYVPAFLSNYEYNGLTAGENFAITQMKKGEKVIAYMPSRLGHNGEAATFSNGYGGNYQITAIMTPIKVEIELVDIFADAAVREKNLIEKCIAANGMDESDKIEGKEYELYVKPLTRYFPNENPQTPEEIAEEKKNEEEGAYTVINKDEELYIYRDIHVIQEEKTDNLLPGEPNEGEDFGLFLVKTDRIALADAKWDDFIRYTPVYVKPSAESETIVYAIREAFQQRDIYYKSSFMIVTQSEYTYGRNGHYESTEPYGEIPPYTPLLIKVYVERKTYKPGDELLTDFGQPIQ